MTDTNTQNIAATDTPGEAQYTAAVFAPDGSQQVRTLPSQTMAPPVSFDFPQQTIYTQNPFLAR